MSSPGEDLRLKTEDLRGLETEDARPGLKSNVSSPKISATVLPLYRLFSSAYVPPIITVDQSR